MDAKNVAKDVVLGYIGALDRQDYESAQRYLKDQLPIRGPGEPYDRADRFIEMLRSYRSKYEVKRVFADRDEVCVLYDLATPRATVFTCSWYRVHDGKIASIQTIFDPRPFAPPPGKESR